MSFAGFLIPFSLSFIPLSCLSYRSKAQYSRVGDQSVLFCFLYLLGTLNHSLPML